MDRREALGSAGLLALSVLAIANRATAQETAHLHHGGHYKALSDAAGICVAKGQVCVNHCLELLGTGDSDLAGCARSVSQMLSLCSALQGLANQDSRYLPGLAKVAMDACNDCAAECKKHADNHEPCKACMESCEACARECKKLAT